jgi:hypothetical protein
MKKICYAAAALARAALVGGCQSSQPSYPGPVMVPPDTTDQAPTDTTDPAPTDTPTDTYII